jgi:phosphatidylglycerophosphate synthase
MMEHNHNIARRPLKSRDTRWAAAVAGWLARAGVRPNFISLSSLVFAAGSGLCLALAGSAAADWQWSCLMVLAAAGIQLRLLCNLFDGMVAIEGGFKTPSGELYNELPDRFADVFVLCGAAYATPEVTWSGALGWSAAILAVITAYVRALGVAAGASPYFIGPMAKPHRMAVMTAACLVAACRPAWSGTAWALPVALCIIAAGCLLTILRRGCLIAAELKAK